MLTRLVYVSQPFGFDEAMLAGILMGARRNNRRDGITGALICRHDLFLQLIEGDEGPIEALYARIAADDRHQDVTRLCSGPTPGRLFPDWAMLDDPARSWLWSSAEVEEGAVKRAPVEEIHTIFERVARETRTG